MTFQAYETSLSSGQPILLFDFQLGSTHWLYCTADRDIVYQAGTYGAAPISRSAPVQSSDVRRQTMRVTAPKDIAVASVFSQYPPGADMLLKVTVLHRTDPDVQGVVDWIGRVIAPEWRGAEVEFACEPVYTSVQTIGLRRRWGLNCPHVLYGTACGVDRNAFRVTATIGSVSGFNVTSSGFVAPAGLSFNGGYLEWQAAAGYFERRSIDAVSGTTLTLAYGSSDLVPGLVVFVYPGCARTMTNCNAFGNILNYGGQPNIPTKNPMDGSIVNPVF